MQGISTYLIAKMQHLILVLLFQRTLACTA